MGIVCALVGDICGDGGLVTKTCVWDGTDAETFEDSRLERGHAHVFRLSELQAELLQVVVKSQAAVQVGVFQPLPS